MLKPQEATECAQCGQPVALCLIASHLGLCAECVEEIAGANARNAETFGLPHNVVALRKWAMQSQSEEGGLYG